MPSSSSSNGIPGVSLNEEIVGYLTVNNIAFTSADYRTGQPAGQADQILYWNTGALGAQPSQSTLDSTYPTYLGRQIQAQNTAKANALIADIQWALFPSVADAEVSNPFLSNQNQYFAYQSAVRAIAVTPPTTPATFPAVPTPSWASA